MSLDPDFRKRLRSIGHRLHPVVTIAGNGLSQAVGNELERALHDHELVKLRLAIDDRESRSELIIRITSQFHAEVVQRIGKVVVLYRRNPQANPRLTNVPA